MTLRVPRHAHRSLPYVAAAAALLGPIAALARSGSGEHYTPDLGSDSDSFSSSSSSGDDSALLFALVELAIRYPKVGVPLLIAFVIGSVVFKRNRGPDVVTRRAFARAEAQASQKTRVEVSDINGWVRALTLKDPAFSLTGLYGRVRKLFVEVQDAWFEQDLSNVRGHLSDAMFQRLVSQIDLLKQQGLRDAITGVEVLGVTLVGLDQSEWFDTVHVRINARMRDLDVPATLTDAEARHRASGSALESFVEVWSFVRKPGVATRPGQDLSQGKCPNCGAGFKGGATNACAYCDAVVNAGTYDWVLSEVTQAIEHVPHHARVDGLMQARQLDPALNLEILEDRASLIFWKWIRAQSHNEPRELAKLATPTLLGVLESQIMRVRAHNARRMYRDCALGGVTVRLLHVGQFDRDEAHIELRWSAKMGVTRGNATLPEGAPSVPQRWVFVLTRAAGATTRTDCGLSTHRCPNCNKALTESLTSTCDFCSAELGSGERDWVLSSADTFEAWDANQQQRYGRVSRDNRVVEASDRIIDVEERTRLLSLMAMLAVADGEVGGDERKLLKMCAARWSVPWPAVEALLAFRPDAFEQVVPKQSPEAESLLGALVQMALIDGTVDKRERQLLHSAAVHLGIPEKLPALLPA